MENMEWMAGVLFNIRYSTFNILPINIMEIRKLLKRIAITTAILAIFGYSLFVFKGLVLGPRIILNGSLDGFATTTPLITVSGRASRVKNLFLNGSTTTLDLVRNLI